MREQLSRLTERGARCTAGYVVSAQGSHFPNSILWQGESARSRSGLLPLMTARVVALVQNIFPGLRFSRLPKAASFAISGKILSHATLDANASLMYIHCRGLKHIC